MKDFTIKELMVPISEYATVDQGATLFDAISALEKAQEVYEYSKYTHRAILVLDKNQQVIGKLSQLDVLRAIEPRETRAEDITQLSQYGFSPKFIRSLQAQRRVIQSVPLRELCIKGAKLPVEEFMQSPTEGEYVDINAPLDIAVHQLVLGEHLSLLVTEEKKIVGILRLTDVFATVFHMMRETESMQTEDRP
ncbi:MAG: CBS domain-containing protein [Desulfobacteraceae bacterium]|nr:CBS domain-containing protein [Desulfobacteraceae bacterium]